MQSQSTHKADDAAMPYGDTSLRVLASSACTETENQRMKKCDNMDFIEEKQKTIGRRRFLSADRKNLVEIVDREEGEGQVYFWKLSTNRYMDKEERDELAASLKKNKWTLVW